MAATPEFYRNILKDAEAIYDQILNEVRLIDEDGFHRIVAWKSIEDGIEQLSWTDGYLSATIKTFGKKDDSASKNRFKKCRKKIRDLLDDLKKKYHDRPSGGRPA